MFWNKAKQILKDKEVGLVFNWRNTYPLKYPLAGFIILSLIAHFFFLQIFRIPSSKNSHHALNTASLLFLSEANSPETHRLLSYAESLSIVAPRGSSEIDPLTRGIDDQLAFHMTAGLYNWAPSPLPYPITPFEETGTADLSWEHGLPPVNEVFLAESSTPIHAPSSESRIEIESISPELKSLLPASLPPGNSPSSLIGEEISFTLMIDRNGSVLFLAPLDKTVESQNTGKQGERWLRAINWNPSRNGASGIINLTWEGRPHD